MRTNLIWSGIEYDSKEHCSITTRNGITTVDSVIVGSYQHDVYRVAYKLIINNKWQLTSVEINSLVNNKETNYHLRSDGTGNWTSHNIETAKFKGCIDIDISLTPFTNTLPINRLNLADGQSAQIKVLYFNLLEQQLKPLHQQYTCLSSTEYKYENIPNDFEAIITIDEQGLVVNYPQLFTKTVIQESDGSLI